LSTIHFLGFLSNEDKVALLTLCYAVLFPSHLRSAAFGISLLEGAMYGKPLISSEIGTGTSFINIANETGLVVQPSDPLALRQAMRLCGKTLKWPLRWDAKQNKDIGSCLQLTRWSLLILTCIES
jgi:glycosyltransferase involved in cell wall biosynthesis